MKNSLLNLAGFVGVCALLVILSGCETDLEKGKGDRALLKKGQTVKEGMGGWVAVPLTEPAIVENKEKALKYIVVRANNVIPFEQAGWVAMPPPLFEKLSGIKAEAPKEAANIEQRVVLREGKSVPKQAAGWVAVPFQQPQIEKQKKGLEMAQLLVNQIVSKEMHGWVAIDRETLSKLVEPYMNTGDGAELPTVKPLAPPVAPKADSKSGVQPEAAPNK
jgi:hypothetical protein